jgi:hypothetical protein
MYLHVCLLLHASAGCDYDFTTLTKQASDHSKFPFLPKNFDLYMQVQRLLCLKWFTIAPAQAVPKAVARAGLQMAQIDFFEVLCLI